MDDKTRMELEDITVDLRNAWSAEFVLTEALWLNAADAGTYTGAMSLLTDVISRIENNLDGLIESAKY